MVRITPLSKYCLLCKFGCIVTFLVFLAIRSLPAQSGQDPGDDTIGSGRSYSGDKIAGVNLSNGSLNFQLPVVSYPQRGGSLQVAFVLTYKNIGIQVGAHSRDPSYAFGGLTLSPTFLVTVDNATLTDLDGSHPLDAVPSISQNAALDGSGYFVRCLGSSTASCPTQVVARGGITYDFASIQNGQTYTADTSTVSAITDANGNQITIEHASGSTIFTDTIGRSISMPLVWNTTGNTALCPGALTSYPNQWTVPGAVSAGSGASTTRTYQICVANLFAGGQYAGQTITSITGPDGRTWTFGYDQDQSSGFGDLQKVTMPEGHTITYSWAPFFIPDGQTPDGGSSGCNPHYGVAYRSIVSKTDDINTADQHVWTYAYMPYSGAALQRHDDGSSGATAGSWYTVRVTDPNGNQTDHSFGGVQNTCSYREYETAIYQGPVAPQRLLSVTQDGFDGFTGAVQAPDYLPQAGNIWKTYHVYSSANLDPDNEIVETYTYPTTSMFTGGQPLNFHQPIVSNHNGVISSTQYQWQVNGDYLRAGLIDQVANSTLSNGQKVSGMSYKYDESSVSSSGITYHHTSSPVGIRGNLTSSVPWTPSGTAASTHTSWYDTGMKQGATDARLHSQIIAYDSTGLWPKSLSYPPTSSSRSGGSAAHNQYFQFEPVTGRLISRTDENGSQRGDPQHTTTYSYDSVDHLVDVQGPSYDPSQPQPEVQYCYKDLPSSDCSGAPFADPGAPPNSVVTAVRLASGWRVERNEYDTANRATRHTLLSDPEGSASSETHYNSLGLVDYRTNPHRASSLSTDGAVHIWYDALGRIIVSQDQQGYFSRFCYNGLSISNGSNQDNCAGSTLTVPQGSMYSYVETFSPTSAHRLAAYDEVGNLAFVQEPDPVTNSLAVQTFYNYSAAGQLVGIASGGRPSRQMSYDMLGNLVAEYHPEMGDGSGLYTCQGANGAWSVCYTRDENGNITSRIDARGIKTSYTYDELDRLRTKSYSAVSPSLTAAAATASLTTPVTYYYDDVTSSYAGIGHRTGMNDNDGQTSWLYDNVGNAVRMSRYAAYSGFTDYTTATFGPDGSIATKDDSSYTYSPAGRLLAISTQAGISASGPATYWPNGLLHTSIQSADDNGGTALFTNAYNGRLQKASTTVDYKPSTQSISNTVLSLSYGYEPDKSLMTVQNNMVLSKTETYHHDYLGRLSSAQGSSGWQTNYVYDAYGNLLAKNPGAGTASTESMPDLSIGVDNRVSSQRYASDPAGNVVTDGISAFAYDAEGRLLSASGTAYTYDGDGRRVSRSAANWRYDIFFDLLGRDHFEYSGDTSDTVTQYFFHGKLAERQDSYAGDTAFPLVDHLGSVRAVTNERPNNLVNYLDYSPWGEAAATNDNTVVPYTFSGYDSQQAVAVLYAGSRSYKPTWGRFLSPDASFLEFAKLADPQSHNLFAYARNNPVQFNDPSGFACGDGSYDNDRECGDEDPQPYDGTITGEMSAVCTPCGPIGDLIGGLLDDLLSLLDSSGNITDAEENESSLLDSIHADQPNTDSDGFLLNYVMGAPNPRSIVVNGQRARDVTYTLYYWDRTKGQLPTRSQSFVIELKEQFVGGVPKVSLLHSGGTKICNMGDCNNGGKKAHEFVDSQGVYAGSPYSTRRDWTANGAKIRVWDNSTNKAAAYEILHLNIGSEFRVDYYDEK